MARSLILRWLDDESFYSWCVRHRRFFGYQFAETPLATAIGTGWRAPRHDFPCNLSVFDTLNIPEIGVSERIIKERTILPFFAPFQSEANLDGAINSMKGQLLGSIKYRLGLIVSKYGAEHPLKFCSACAEEDTERHGVAYWHLSHQYPGSLLCLPHKMELTTFSQKRKWNSPHSWALPNDECNHNTQKSYSLLVQNALTSISKSAVDLARAGFGLTFQPELVAETYRQELQRRHELGETVTDLETALLGHFDLLAPFHPLDALPRDRAALRSMLQQLTTTPRGHSHPLKHLALISWLFGDLQHFSAAYLAVEADHLRPANEPQTSQLAHHHETAALPPNTPRGAPRPKILKGGMRSEALRQLAEGALKAEICSSFGVTISTVNKLLRSAAEAKAEWFKASFSRSQVEHRRQWLSMQEHHPGLGAKALRSHASAVYAWLYRNDRSWLLQHTATLPNGRCGNNSNIDWNARDLELESAVQGAIARMQEDEPGATPSREQLFMLIPRLSACLEKRNRYPNTRALLSTLCKPPALGSTQRP
ncbi:TPA: TnsD family Tn7-like transposition protein [Pseudomonas aeruginosa]